MISADHTTLTFGPITTMPDASQMKAYYAMMIDVQPEEGLVFKDTPNGNFLIVVTAPDASYFAVDFEGVVTGDPVAAKASIDDEIARRSCLEACKDDPYKLGYLLLARELCARYAAAASRGFV